MNQDRCTLFRWEEEPENDTGMQRVALRREARLWHEGCSRNGLYGQPNSA